MKRVAENQLTKDHADHGDDGDDDIQVCSCISCHVTHRVDSRQEVNQSNEGFQRADESVLLKRQWVAFTLAIAYRV